MALGNKRIKDTFRGVLNFNDANNVLGAAVQIVKDGTGNESVLGLSTTDAQLNLDQGRLEVISQNGTFYLPTSAGQTGYVLTSNGPGGNLSWTSIATFGENLIPDVNDLRLIGTSSLSWNSLFLGSGGLWVGDERVIFEDSGNIVFKNDDDITIRSTGFGNLVIDADIVLSDNITISTSGGDPVVFDSEINMGGTYRITGVPAPASALDAVNLQYLESTISDLQQSIVLSAVTAFSIQSDSIQSDSISVSSLAVQSGFIDASTNVNDNPNMYMRGEGSLISDSTMYFGIDANNDETTASFVWGHDSTTSTGISSNILMELREEGELEVFGRVEGERIVANSGGITIRTSADARPDIEMTNDGIIVCENDMLFSIDGNNSSTNARFVWSHNASAATPGFYSDELMSLSESGNLQILGNILGNNKRFTPVSPQFSFPNSAKFLSPTGSYGYAFVIDSPGTDSGGIFLRVGDENNDESALTIWNTTSAYSSSYIPSGVDDGPREVFNIKATTGDLYTLGYATFRGTDSTSSGTDIVMNSTGRILRISSSEKYKKEIEPLEIDYAERFFYSAEPVWYRSTLSADPSEWSYYGYIAEQVHEVEPRLVIYNTDEEGNLIPESFDYSRVSVLLHKMMLKQQEEINQLKQEIENLKNGGS